MKRFDISLLLEWALKPLRALGCKLCHAWSRRKPASEAITVTGKDTPVSFRELGELYETLHDMAIRDPLTGIYNRALLFDRLKQLFVVYRRTPG